MTSLFDLALLESQVNLFHFALFLFVTDNIFMFQYFLLFYCIKFLLLSLVKGFLGKESSNWTCKNYSSVQDTCTLDVKQSYTQYDEAFTVIAFTICFATSCLGLYT